MQFHGVKMEYWQKIVRPTFVINPDRVRKNIEFMAEKARLAGVRFCPHFKTHQSAEIGNWFREFGVEAITVSSVEMAEYFANEGWKKITIAFPVNLRELDKINELSQKIELALLAESSSVINHLNHHLNNKVDLWIKINTGYNRTGIAWDNSKKITAIYETINKCSQINLKGILTHAGNTYLEPGKAQIHAAEQVSIQRMQVARNELRTLGCECCEISIGDTPGCSVLEEFPKVDEIRPGNFTYYDLMQMELGSCNEEQIAVVVACPVVAKHQSRSEIIIYGGAIHLSKEYLTDNFNQQIFGKICLPRPDGWGKILPNTYVKSLSQEHGIIKIAPEIYDEIKVGDILMVLPVHSCLAANLHRKILTTKGDWLSSGWN